MGNAPLKEGGRIGHYQRLTGMTAEVHGAEKECKIRCGKEDDEQLHKRPEQGRASWRGARPWRQWQRKKKSAEHCQERIGPGPPESRSEKDESISIQTSVLSTDITGRWKVPQAIDSSSSHRS